VGKYISIEKAIADTKEAYYDALQKADQGWHEEKNDPTPFIRYMLTVILACYTEFEDRVGLMDFSGKPSTAYDVVKKYVEEKVGKFTGAEVVANCPSIGRSSALAALKKLTDEDVILRQGAGRGTYYIRKRQFWARSFFPASQGPETFCGSIASTQSSPLAAILGASVKI
jgi:Fic family protein